jgi:hypothetical protein
MGAEVAKEMLWLAWQACRGPLGLGILKDAPGASKADVWSAMTNRTDYEGMHCPEKGEVNADYVFGRMMKLYFKFTDTMIEWPDHFDAARPDYNSWAHAYPTVTALFDAAVKEVVAA